MTEINNSERIKFYIRHRPIVNISTDKSSQDLSSKISKNQIKQNAKNICTYYQTKNKFEEKFECNQYFDPTVTQEELFDTVVRPMITNALLGYSGTILSYGPINSGKTFTMRGNIGKESTKGIISRCLEQLLQECGNRCELWLSYCQVHGDNIIDLLTGKQKLILQHDDPIHKDYANVKDLSIISINKLEDIQYVLHKKKETMNNLKKKLKYENKNIPSTEGHSILIIKLIDTKQVEGTETSENIDNTIYIDQSLSPDKSRDRSNSNIGEYCNSIRSGTSYTAAYSPTASISPDKDNSFSPTKLQFFKQQQKLHRISTLCLVDMAGTIRSVSNSVYLLQEVKAINQSLSAFGECITAMVEGQAHIPYRASIFTRLLQRYIDRNNSISMIVHVAPYLDTHNESLSALRLGSKAALIEVSPRQANHRQHTFDDSTWTYCNISNNITYDINIHSNSMIEEEEESFLIDDMNEYNSSSPVNNLHESSYSNIIKEPNDDISNNIQNETIKKLELQLALLQNDYSNVLMKLNMKELEVIELRHVLDHLANQSQDHQHGTNNQIDE